jgi:signal transduction histidine kinase
MNSTPLQDKISILQLAFKGLEEHELREMAELVQFRTYPPGHILCHEGEYEDSFYVVAEGSVVVSKKMLDEAGQHILRVGGRGDLVGEMGLIQNAPRAATVRTLTECTLLEMGRKDFETILSRSPRMAMDIIRITLDRLRANDHMAVAELQRTNSVLRQLDRNKLDFIQVAAHELRTPLTVLSGYVEILRNFPEVKSNPRLGEAIDRLMNGAGRIQEVVNMMLDVTRIDSELLTIGTTPVPVRLLVSDVLHSFTETARGRRIRLATEYQDDTPDIYGDIALIQKAMYHLVVNAIKYTPDGGSVTIRTSACVLDEEIPGVEISISDTGIGLDAEHHELIFEKFYQVGEVALHSSGKTSFKGGGPGLGLALVRGVARAHGGRVWVESPGHDETLFPGSTFHLQLPVIPPVPQTPVRSK